MSDIIIKAQHVHYGYGDLRVLQDVNFSLHAGERVAILGVSGVGKSTLLHLLGLLDAPSTGHILVRHQGALHETHKMTDAQKAFLRCQSLGIVFQFHHLLQEFTAKENVMLPQLMKGVGTKEAAQKATMLLTLVGLKDRQDRWPNQLSGGQQQRVAIARALSNDPLAILADEPTGNLDEKTADDVFDLLMFLSQEKKLGVVMTTHNKAMAQRMDTVLGMHQGRLCSLASS